MTMGTLPTEILLAITKYLPSIRDVVSCGSTCQKWHAAASTTILEYDKGSIIAWALTNKHMGIVDRAILAGDHLLRLHHLTLAAATGDLRIAKAILASDAVMKQWRAWRNDDCWMTPLVAAAASGSIEMMQLLLDVPQVDALGQDGHGWSPLGIACFFRNHSAVQLLLQHGCDPTQQCGTMSVVTPLQLAVDMADYEITKPLLGSIETQLADDKERKLRELGAALLTVAEYGQVSQSLYDSPSKTLETLTAVVGGRPTPGTQNDALRCLELLLSQGVEVDYIFNGPNLTPFVRATRAGHGDLALALLRRGADPFRTLHSGLGARTPLFYAASHSNVELVQELLDRGAQVEFDVRQAGLRTAIQMAAEAGQPEVAKLLLPTVSDIDFSSWQSPSALYLAALSGSYETFRILVDYGASVHRLNFDGFSPLHVANDPDIVRLLLKMGVPVDILNEEDSDKHKIGTITPLLKACTDGRGSVVQVLLEAGANPAAHTRHGSSTMHEAASSGLSQVIVQLEKAGVPIEQATKNGDTPLHNAIRRGHTAAVKQLLDLGANVNAQNNKGIGALDLAMHSPDITRVLVQYGADINQKSRQGLTLMHKLVKQRCDGAARDAFARLVKLGINIDARDNQGYSALHTAANFSKTPFMELCIDGGADMEITNDVGWTPLMTVCHRQCLDGVNCLLDRGADVHATVNGSAAGDSALTIAVRSGKPAIVTAPLRHGADPASVRDEANAKCAAVLRKWASGNHRS